MADYYTNFSFTVPLPDEASQKHILDIHRKMVALRDAAESGEREPKCSETFTIKLPADFEDQLVNDDIHEIWSFELEEDNQNNRFAIWFHSEYGGIHAAASLCQYILQKFAVAKYIAFEWADTCSRPRDDAYGGGAAFITTKEMEFHSTGEWLRERKGMLDADQQETLMKNPEMRRGAKDKPSQELTA